MDSNIRPGQYREIRVGSSTKETGLHNLPWLSCECARFQCSDPETEISKLLGCEFSFRLNQFAKFAENRPAVDGVESFDLADQRRHIHRNLPQDPATTGSGFAGAAGAGVVRALKSTGSWNGLNRIGSQ